MPTYQYACTECGHAFEQFQSFSDDALTVCPQCEGRLRKVYNAVGVVFKGSGFYRTDSRADGDKGSGSSGPDKSSKDGGGKDGSSAASGDGGGKASTSDGGSGTTSTSTGSSADKAGSGAGTTGSTSAA